MKISYKWLKEYINTDLEIDKISEILTDTGLEVEGIEEVESIKGGLKGVVIGEVLTCETHPNADRLKKTTISIGADEPLNIVCGAPNVAQGQKVLIATVGTTIYSDEGNFDIKKSKIRGELSQGMICAEDELNLGNSHDGILVLDATAIVGTPAAEYFNIQSDFVFEIGLTPNRTDAMCHYGVARDLRAALLRYGHKDVKLALPSVDDFKVQSNTLDIDIEVKDFDACPRYSGVSLSNVSVSESPAWLKNRLTAIGLSPINNIVDVTNFVLHETGHPLHGFDADKIEGNKIIVQKLKETTPFITLDDKERKIDPNDLMICDAKNPLVIAGTMGGKNSGVSNSTKNIFLESAYFNSVSVRKTAKRHALNTDSSFRYERGVDPDVGIYALKRAALLIQELAGGEISMDIKDLYPNPMAPFEVNLNLNRMTKLIGQEIESEIVIEILDSLDIKVLSQTNDDLQLSVPRYRADVQREADIIEEVLRIYGFNAIHFGSKMNISVAPTDSKGEAKYREHVSTLLTGKGFSEIMNNSLTKGHFYQNFGFNSEDSIEMLNPLSQDLGVMRQSLLFGGLEVAAYNSNRQRSNLRFYEFGKTYRKSDGNYSESSRLGIWITGDTRPLNWKNTAEKSDFYVLKAEVQSVLNHLGLSELKEEELENSEIYENGLQLLLNNKAVITLGKIKPSLSEKLDLKQEIYFADFDWKYLSAKAKKIKVQFSNLPKHPEVRRDLALLVNQDVNYNTIKEIASRAERKILKEINLFDVYEGKNLPAGKKSYALSFIMRDDEKTLNDKQVDKVMQKILNSLKNQVEVELR